MKTIAFVMLLACGCADSLDTGDGGQQEAGSDALAFDGALFGETSTDATSATGCSTESQLVYVVDVNRNMYSFDPPSLAFTQIGQVDCTSSSLFSMAVDRSATAWVLTQSGTMVRYDIKTHTCTPLSFATGQHGFVTFGMGFAANAKGSSDETLFVASDSQGLGTVDTASLAVTPIAMFDKLGGRTELSGTGDAKLFGLFEATPYTLGEIDKPTAKVLSEVPQSVTVINNFAFAFWGGDFWMFVASDVLHYKPSDQSTTKVTSVSFEIVGAGVSTCAPTTPPN